MSRFEHQGFSSRGTLSRRMFLAGSVGAAAVALGACASASASLPNARVEDDLYARMYAPMPQETFPIPGVNLERVDKKYYRQQVSYPTTERVGTIIVDTANFFLYLVQENGMAMRYGVGLGRAGFGWSGRARVAWKRPWPKWTPPEDMIAREPELEQWSAANGGMPPGLENPLGARALYIFEGNKDTLYRVHGTAEYWTIGKAVSSGCVRMINQDVIDLYSRVPVDIPIVVT